MTDDSSVAFDIAALDRPVVYYQFDRERVMAGGHIGRHGYFDAGRDGFGPVAIGHDEAVAAIVEALEGGAHPSPGVPGANRRTFPVRDGRACERVVAAIEALEPPCRGRARPTELVARAPPGTPISCAAGAAASIRRPGPSASGRRPAASILARAHRLPIVTAACDVEPYLPDFIGLDRAPDVSGRGASRSSPSTTGRPTASREILEAWRARSPDRVHVLAQPNAGEAAARNLGLEDATGDWVTFTDPDDVLDPDYFERR